jgi:hypothetical protein
MRMNWISVGFMALYGAFFLSGCTLCANLFDPLEFEAIEETFDPIPTVDRAASALGISVDGTQNETGVQNHQVGPATRHLMLEKGDVGHRAFASAHTLSCEKRRSAETMRCQCRLALRIINGEDVIVALVDHTFSASGPSPQQALESGLQSDAGLQEALVKGLKEAFRDPHGAVREHQIRE